MPNIDNVAKVLAAIEDPSNFFSMKQFAVAPEYLVVLTDAVFERSFGAPKPSAAGPCCIAGWANHIAGSHLKDERAAAEFLGLPFPAVSDKLFRPRLKRHKDRKHDLAAVTRDEAISALRKLIEIGEVDWDDEE
jgi:hypothetical protein